MDFEFELEGESGRRRAHRERVRGLVVIVEDHEEPFVVHDVSASGLALVDTQRRLRRGRACLVTLAIGDRTLVRDLPGVVVREASMDRWMAGMAFGDLSPRQEAWLDKLVLEIQKRRITLRKAREAADNLEDKKKTDRAEQKT
jgi:hypothetical protein